MSKFIGRLVRLGIGRETSRGAGAVADIWLPHVGCTLGAKVDEARVEGALGSLADSQAKMVLEKYASGEVNGELRDQSFGFLLYALLGSYTAPGGSTPFTHPFTLSESNSHTSLALTIKDSDLASEMYKLAMLNTLEITVELGGLVNFRAAFLSLDPIPCSASPSITAENRFSKKHVKIKVAANLASLDAATALEIKSLSLTINKNAERDSVLGTVHPIDILNKAFSIEGTLNFSYEDNTFRGYMLDASHKAVRIDIENTDVDLGGSVHPRLRIELPSVDFSGWEPDRSLGDIVKQTINLKANYDATYGIISTCSLINAKASY